MADSLKDDSPRARDDADLASLEITPPAAVGPEASAGALAADDDKIDLRALVKLSSAAPRATSEPPATSASEQDRELYAAASPSLAPLAVPRRRFGFLAPLVIGFALGLGSGALLFGGGGSSEPTPPPRAAVTEPPTAVASEGREPVVQAAASAVSPAAVPAPPPAVPAAAQAPDLPEPAAPVAAGALAPRAPRSAEPPSAHEPAASPSASATAPAAPPPARADAPVMVLTKREEASSASPSPPPSAADGQPRPRSTDEAIDLAVSNSTVRSDSMLGQALAAAEEQRTGGGASDGSLPLSPSREQVSSAMAVMLPAIRGCAMGQSGLATASIVVQSDGRVASVAVTGAPFQGTASGRCMEGVVRRARFPRFKQPSFRVQFPFAIQ